MLGLLVTADRALGSSRFEDIDSTSHHPRSFDDASIPMAPTDEDVVAAELAKLEGQLKTVQNDEAIVRKNYDGIAEKLRTVQANIEAANTEIEKLRAFKESMSSSLGEREKVMETLMSKAATLSQKREALQKKIREKNLYSSPRSVS